MTFSYFILLRLKLVYSWWPFTVYLKWKPILMHQNKKTFLKMLFPKFSGNGLEKTLFFNSSMTVPQFTKPGQVFYEFSVENLTGLTSVPWSTFGNNKTLKYLNSSTWGRTSLPTQRGHSTLFQLHSESWRSWLDGANRTTSTAKSRDIKPEFTEPEPLCSFYP